MKSQIRNIERKKPVDEGKRMGTEKIIKQN